MTSATDPPRYSAPMAELDPVGATLLKAAGDLLSSEGPGALTVRRIASAAGCSTMNVYSRFGGKDGVVEQLFTEGFRRLSEAMTAQPTSDDPLADIRSCGLGYRQFALDHQTLYSVMFDRVVPEFRPSAQAQALANSTLEVLANRLERAMQAGLLRDADPLQTAALVWATTHGVMSLELKTADRSLIDWPAVYDEALTMIIKGLS